MMNENEWEGGIAPLTTRSQVKKQLWNDENLERSMKKLLLGLWDEGLVHVFPNETVMPTKEGAELGKKLIQDSEFKGGYSSDVVSLFRHFVGGMASTKTINCVNCEAEISKEFQIKGYCPSCKKAITHQ